MTWTITYYDEEGKTIIEWRDYSESVDGRAINRQNGFPSSDAVNEAVNNILESINSVPEGLEAAQEFRPGMIEYQTVQSDSS